MKQKQQGFLLFYDWCELMEELSPKHFKMLLTAMFDYQIKGEEPPEFPDKIKGTAKLIFAQLRRRAANAENGRRGGEARAEKERKAGSPSPLLEAKGQAKSQAKSQAKAQAKVQALLEAYRQDKDKTKTKTKTETKTETSQDQDKGSSLSVESAEPLEPPAAADAPAPAGRESERQFSEEREERGGIEGGEPLFGPTQEGAETAKRGYGKHGNVPLTEGEYGSLKKEIPHADEYIDFFSEKLYRNGYRYQDCYTALRSWWLRDCQLAAKRGDPPPGVAAPLPSDSFRYDRFFQAALARSLPGTDESDPPPLAGTAPPAEAAGVDTCVGRSHP